MHTNTLLVDKQFMVTITLFALSVLIFVILVVRAFEAAGSLSSYIDYKNGTYMLYLNTQQHVIGHGKLNYEIIDEQGEALFQVLRKRIQILYAVIFPMLLSCFLAHLLGV